MQSFLILLAVVATLFSASNAFAPIQSASRTSVRGSTIVMDGKTRALRDRIKTVKNTRRITEAMRLVAAARVRRAQDAVLKTRPLIGQLQLVSFPCFISLNRCFGEINPLTFIASYNSCDIHV